jgi:hypothetical protein
MMTIYEYTDPTFKFYLPSLSLLEFRTKLLEIQASPLSDFSVTVLTDPGHVESYIRINGYKIFYRDKAYLLASENTKGIYVRVWSSHYENLEKLNSAVLKIQEYMKESPFESD